MSGFARTKTNIEARLARTEADRRTILASIGRMLVESSPDTTDPAIAEAIDHEARSREHMLELDRARERISSIEDRLAEIDRQRRDLMERQKKIDGDLEPQYRSIGEEAFRVFRNNPLIDQEYADIFTPLLELTEETRQLRREVDEAESERTNKAFLEKMVVRGRLIVLKNRLAIKEGQRKRLQTDAGRQIAATDFIRTIGDPALDEAAAPFLEMMTESGRLAAEVKTLDDERAALANELTSLGVERRSEARLVELARELAQVHTENEDALVLIANLARDTVGTDGSSEQKDAYASLAEVESRIDGDRTLVGRLETAIEAESVRGEIEQIATQIGRKQKQAESIQEEIARLQERQQGLEKTEARLRKEHGDLAELADATTTGSAPSESKS